MTKATYHINIAYTFDPTHKGTNYTFDGEQWVNGGEFAEIVTKSVLGYKAEKDANGSYDTTSDIEELNASVKSSRFTLVNKVLGDTFEETINRYFETVHSTRWIYTVTIEDTAILYTMDKAEFKAFLNTFCGLNERKLVRCKHTTTKMLQWLDRRVA